MNKIIYQDSQIIIFECHSQKYKCSIIVDREDWKRVNKYKWYALPRRDKTGKVYIYTPLWINKKRKTFYIHRYITNAEKGKEIDHKDNNPLNNRKKNLRYATRQEQSRNQIVNRTNNSTGYKGVCKIDNKYLSYIKYNNKQYRLGWFNNSISAAMQYNKAAEKQFGEFACLNNV